MTTYILIRDVLKHLELPSADQFTKKQDALDYMAVLMMEEGEDLSRLHLFTAEELSIALKKHVIIELEEVVD